MAKKKRKERRRKQQANAVNRGDFSAIRAIAERNPEAGANALASALEGNKVDSAAPETIQLAESLVDRLREKARLDLAVRLVGCFPAPTPVLRLSRALCAIALGDDSSAQADAVADARVGRIVAPLLAALQGKKIPRTPPKSPPAVRSVYALSRAVAFGHAGHCVTRPNGVAQHRQGAGASLRSRRSGTCARSGEEASDLVFSIVDDE